MSNLRIVRGKAADFASANQVIPENTVTINSFFVDGQETEDGQRKYGNGFDHWNDLQYENEVSSLFSTLQIGDANYPGPFHGNLPTIVPLRAGSNDGNGNQVGTFLVPENFIGCSIDYKINASGDSKSFLGSYINFEIGGDFSGNCGAYGQYIWVNNRQASGSGVLGLIGLYADVSVEGPATQAIGVFGAVGGGNVQPCPTLIGGFFQALSGHISADTLTGVIAKAFLSGDTGLPTTTGIATAIQAIVYQYSAAETINDARGLSLDSWNSGGGPIGVSYGIYADASIDIGAQKWFIYSLSTSPSKFSGDVQLADAADFSFGTATGSKIGASSTEKLGFWGQTPIVRPTVQAGVGHTVDDVITALQNIGLFGA